MFVNNFSCQADSPWLNVCRSAEHWKYWWTGVSDCPLVPENSLYGRGPILQLIVPLSAKWANAPVCLPPLQETAENMWHKHLAVFFFSSFLFLQLAKRTETLQPDNNDACSFSRDCLGCQVSQGSRAKRAKGWVNSTSWPVLRPASWLQWLQGAWSFGVGWRMEQEEAKQLSGFCVWRGAKMISGHP